MAIGSDQLQKGAVDSRAIKDGSVAAGDLAAGAVDATAIGANAVGNSEMADNAIGNAEMADNAVGNAEMADNAVGSPEIADGSVATNDLQNGAVTPQKMSLAGRNETGSTLVIGELVYVSGWSAANNAFLLSRADNDAAGARATYIVTAAINNNQNGLVSKYLHLTGVNTSGGGAAVGDPIYLSATAGGWTRTQPTSFNTISQVVGRTTVVDAAIGEIEFDLMAHQATVIGNNEIQNNAITTGKIGDAQVTSGKLDEKTVQYAEVALSKANILAMNGAPVTVLAAPGVGKAIEYMGGTLIYDFDTAAYGGGGDVSIKYLSAADVSAVVTAANSLGAASDKIRSLPALATGADLLANTALVITNATGAFTDPGTAAGVARLKIAYRVHTTGL